MHAQYGQCRGSVIVLHGGAGGWDPKGPESLRRANTSLQTIAADAAAMLREQRDALEVVVECLKAMERDEIFNAGRGATLQADGVPRLTAALMDSASRKFSGVISTCYLNHPSMLAHYLQSQSARVLTNPGAELVARKLGLPVESSLTPERASRWYDKAKSGETGFDTVGCVIRLPTGRLCAGTSTGGRGFEYPGRVSDSATVAGTYATTHAAISATGVGEEIVDDAVAARIETRIRDGMALTRATELCLQEAKDQGRGYGWIAVDASGAWSVARTTPSMSWVVWTDSGEVAHTDGI